MSQTNSHRLRILAAQVLADNTYRTISAQFGESFKAAGDYQRAADEVLAFVCAR